MRISDCRDAGALMSSYSVLGLSCLAEQEEKCQATSCYAGTGLASLSEPSQTNQKARKANPNPGMRGGRGKCVGCRSKGDPRTDSPLQFLREQPCTRKSKQLGCWQHLPTAPKFGGQWVGQELAENMPFAYSMLWINSLWKELTGRPWGAYGH